MSASAEERVGLGGEDAKSKNVVFPARRHPSIHVSFPYASAYYKSTYPGSPNPTGSLSFEVALPKVESKALQGSSS